MGDPGRQPADAGELLRAHELTLRVEQVIGHAVEPLCERGEVARLRVRRASPEIAVCHRVGGGDQALQRPQDQSVHEVAPEHEKHPHLEGDKE